jgi:hypothetical protein
MTIPLYIWFALASAALMGVYSVAIKVQLRYRVCSPLLAGGIALFFVAIRLSGLVTIPNIILAARGFVALGVGYVLNRLMKFPIERQSDRVYRLRLVASILLFAGLSIILLAGR